MDSEKCLLSLQAIIKRFPSPEVVPFFDSWGKIPSGVIMGNNYEIGNFDQCVRTSVNLSDFNGGGDVIDAQYCFLEVPLKNPLAKKAEIPDWGAPPTTLAESEYRLKYRNGLNIGICVPNSCSPSFLEHVFEKAANRVPYGLLLDLSVSRCTEGRTPPLKAINIVGITVFGIFTGLMVLSSLYDFLMSYFEKSPVPIFLAFSVLTNGKKLFAYNLQKSPNAITCLTGIRVLSMTWVIYCHTYMTSALFPAINSSHLITWYKELWSMHILHGTVSVDSFFFISGLLVAWLGFKELDRTNGKLNVIMMYVHRYIRLTPVVGAVLLFAFSINPILYTGPFKYVSLGKNECDSSNWWPILLYISNYFRVSSCFDQTWYLAVDFQLYVLSPLLLIPMWKWGKKFAPVLILICLLSIGSVMFVYISKGFTSLITGTYPDEWKLTYIPTHARCPPWIVGLGFGYFMHVNRNNTIQIPKKYQILGWIMSFSILLAIVFGPYFTISANGDGTVLEAASYEAWKRVSWAVALAWIVFACHFGFGGVIDAFLSHPFWQPLGRLTFALYLIHMTVVRANFGMIRTELHYSNYAMILLFWGSFGISLMAAIIVTLAFESPVLVLEKFIFGRMKSNAEDDRNQQIHQNLSRPNDLFLQMPNKDL
ncbi:nose resistant to fluoxetine protein 6-like [Eupeodes corollae]|uniref:nose resistant to fluoxetine protein 6-like n=1 Tax=Eupeodes corollae TaxID=290404 RepID=UPI002491773D|nr:nose resistant to fluoxetine protein 6-like [Eupeodes corollae]